jgi:N-acetylmuramoyl-L-alanine amidase
MRRLIVVILLLLSSIQVFALSSEECLAENIYREARGEPFLGKIAVAQVVINRTQSSKYPSSICKVVFQQGQFSWTPMYRRPRADNESKNIARLVMDGTYHINNFPATYFVHKSMKLTWHVTKIRTIGNHSFYKLKDSYKEMQ